MNAPLHNHPAYGRPIPMNEAERRAFEAEPEDKWTLRKHIICVVAFNLVFWSLAGFVGWMIGTAWGAW